MNTRYLVDRYSYLDLKGMGVADRVPLRLPLLDLYVPLQVRPELPEAEKGPEAVMAGRQLTEEGVERLGRRLSEPRPVAELVAENDGLVILGDPGSGKTTFLKYLAVTLAAGKAPDLGRQAGLILGRLGWVPEDLEVFVEVPAGPFLYGDGKEERTIAEPYWIGRYPVTNGQYARFVGDGGYERQELWSGEGWKWRLGRKRDGPYDRGEDWVNPIFPRVGVSWYETEAYCRWLTAAARDFSIDGADEPVAAERFRVRLPAEEEWERAARGTDGQ